MYCANTYRGTSGINCADETGEILGSFIRIDILFREASEKMKIGILGAGAMGSLVGAHLKKGGGEVFFIDVYEEHMRAVREKGLTMELENEDAPQTVFVDGAEVSGAGIGVCDAVIVLVKCYDTEKAVTENGQLFGKDTVAITLQNGVGGADLLAKHFDKDHIGLGLLKASGNLLAPGRILGSPRFANSPKGVYFAPFGSDTPYHGLYMELERLLCTGGMPAECTDKINEMIWDKLSNNVMFNGIAALLQIANQDSLYHSDGVILMKEMVRETCLVARAKGIDLSFEKCWETHSTGLLPREQTKTLHYVSMLIDAYHKRKTEIDFINGTVVREGERYGIPTPYNEAIYRLVKVMQDTYDLRYAPSPNL